jgi:dTDP-4-dehydrorhamnose 3,5-epimerase
VKPANFDFSATPLDGLVLLSAKPFGDARGTFSRLFCSEELEAIGFDKKIVQINRSKTLRAGTVRGMHFQWPPCAETKIVSCVRGSVYDVAVDVRQDSPTFLQWHAEMLTEQNRRSLLIPEGFAHGFQALSGDAELIYLHTAPYAPASQGALNVSDPRLGIRWPLEIQGLSDRDRAHPHVTADFRGVARAL